MMISLSITNQQTPHVSLHLNTHERFVKKEKCNTLSFEKNKVAVVLGATGAGKSRLSIDLATRFDGEIINSDKMQVYKGLDVITNKITDEERRGIPHHLLGFIDPDNDFDVKDFVRCAFNATNSIIEKGKLPIIVGGSTSFVRALVLEDAMFRSKYECCAFWVDVRTDILDSFVSKRVDDMVVRGLVEEGRRFFDPNGNYRSGIRRSIGVPELHEFYMNEYVVDDETKDKLLKLGIDGMKSNTRELTRRQINNILSLQGKMECGFHRVDASEAVGKGGDAWESVVVEPCVNILDRFLKTSTA